MKKRCPDCDADMLLLLTSWVCEWCEAGIPKHVDEPDTEPMGFKKLSVGHGTD